MAKVLIKGNEAVAEAAIRCGMNGFFGYPITPSTEILEYLAKHMKTGVVLQAEDETASINMCHGAAATGARVMTATSGPGFSLMQEGLSNLAVNELPVVVAVVSRSGPGLGGLGPSQGDYFQCVKGGGHGHYYPIVIAPSNAQEMYDYTMLAFDLADKWRTPTILLSEAYIGQMMEPVELKARPDTKLPAKDWAITGASSRGGRKQNMESFHLTNELGETQNKAWQAKFEQIRQTEQRWENFHTDDAEYILVGFGNTGRIGKSVVLEARKKGIKVGLIRPITLWPFPTKAFENLKNVKGILSVELSGGQMIEDIKLAVNCQAPVHLCNRMGGQVPSEHEVLRKLVEVFNLAVEV